MRAYATPLTAVAGQHKAVAVSTDADFDTIASVNAPHLRRRDRPV